MRTRFLRLFFGLLLLGLTGFGLSKISFNIQILKLLPDHLSQVEGLSLFLKHFSLPNELIVTLETTEGELSDSQSESLAEALRQRPDLVASAVCRPPWEKTPTEFAELLAYLVANQPAAKVKTLLDRLSPQQAELTVQSTIEKLRDSLLAQEVAMLSYDPFGLTEGLAQSGLANAGMQSEFASADNTFRVLYVTAAPKLGNYKQTFAWIKEVQKVARDWNHDSAIKIGFTGEPAFVAEISSAMEWDMMSSGFSTLIVVGAIFWLCYRRARPLAQLMGMLVLIFVLSLGTAGLFLNQLTVIGVGFASIMIGLSVDYGYFIYQKSLLHHGSVRQLQWICFQNLVWTAGTTAAAFFALNLSSLPGLSQLGNLVGIGVLVGSAVMILGFVPMAVRLKKVEVRPSIIEAILTKPAFTRAGFWLTLAMIVGLSAALLIKGAPQLDFSSRSLRPRHSESYAALDRLQAKLIDDRNLLSLIVEGHDSEEVGTRMAQAEKLLQQAVQDGKVQSFRSTLPLWASPLDQKSNIPGLAQISLDSERLKAAMIAGGFTEESFGLTGQVLAHWARWGKSPLPIWPENSTSQWIFRRTIRHEAGNFLALGMVTPAPGQELALGQLINRPGVHLVSWNLLGSELQRVIPKEFLQVFAGLIGIVFLLLLIGFRGPRDVLLLAATMGLVFLSLAGAMTLLGMSWNFFNLAAILLLLGTGIDYSILLILALRENNGDVADAQRQLGLVIVLCAAAAAAGFGSISWANNLGLASLGKTCALGLVLDALISIFLVPIAWRWIHRKKA